MLKVVLLGDGGVGKSSLMNVYVMGKFAAESFHTIGVEFLIKELVVDGEKVALQIWDTAGQERYRSLRTPFYRGSDCCILTFAVDDLNSFNNLAMWQRESSITLTSMGLVILTVTLPQPVFRLLSLATRWTTEQCVLSAQSAPWNGAGSAVCPTTRQAHEMQ